MATVMQINNSDSEKAVKSQIESLPEELMLIILEFIGGSKSTLIAARDLSRTGLSSRHLHRLTKDQSLKRIFDDARGIKTWITDPADPFKSQLVDGYGRTISIATRCFHV